MPTTNGLIDHLAGALASSSSDANSSTIASAVRSQVVSTLQDLRIADEETIDAAAQIVPEIAIAAIRGAKQIGAPPRASLIAIMEGVVSGTRELGGREMQVTYDSSRAILLEANQHEVELGMIAVATVEGAIAMEDPSNTETWTLGSAAILAVRDASRQIGVEAREAVESALSASIPSVHRERIDALHFKRPPFSRTRPLFPPGASLEQD